MTDYEAFERRQNQRRQALRESEPPLLAMRPACPGQTQLPDTGEHRVGVERRRGERRQQNLGPPPGVEERRFRPDLRGVLFPLYYNHS